MKGWGLVIGVLAGVALVAIALKALPPGIVVVVTLGGCAYGTYRFNLRKKAMEANLEPGALGLQRADGDTFGLAGLPLQLLRRGSGAGGVDNVLWGSWRAEDVRVFDFRYTSNDDGDRRFSCALVALERDVPAVVVEPKMFFTPHAERGQLSVIEMEDRAFGETFDVRAEDPRLAGSLFDDDTRQWMERQNDMAFEMNGRMLLAYVQWERRDLFALLEAAAELGRRLSVGHLPESGLPGPERPTASPTASKESEGSPDVPA
jgi:hypothetical protein